MFDPRNNLANEVSAQLIEHFGDKVFRTMIPRNVRLAEAPSFGKPALFHDKESRGALAYLALAGEMIRRDELPSAPGCAFGPRSAFDPRIIGFMSGKKPSLGRGLAELSPLLARRAGATATEAPQVSAGDRLANLPLDLLQRGKYQPRVDMRPETLSELADSIKAQGLVQPILVRPWAAAIPANRSATKSSPASGAGAPRRWRGSPRFPRSSATCRTRPPSPWRSSRTSSAKT